MSRAGPEQAEPLPPEPPMKSRASLPPCGGGMGWGGGRIPGHGRPHPLPPGEAKRPSCRRIRLNRSRAPLLPLLALLALTACKAERVEVRLTGEAVVAAAAGQPATARFEAELGEDSTTLDAEKRATVDGILGLMTRHFPGAEVDVDLDRDAWSIEVEGDLAVAAAPPAEGAPWHVAARRQGSGIVVSLQPSGSFGAFETAMQAVNSVIAPDAAQPVEFRFSAAGGRVLAGGVVIDGQAHGFVEIPMTGQVVRLLFKDGVWDTTSGTFLYIP